MATPVDRGGGERETVVWPGGAAEAAAVAGLVLIPSLRHSQGCDTAAAVNITPGQHTSSHHCTGPNNHCAGWWKLSLQTLRFQTMMRRSLNP